MKLFFSLLQKNVFTRQRWTLCEQLRLAIIVWIEKTHHRRRRQKSPRPLTPTEFEILHQSRSRGLTTPSPASQRNSGRTQPPARTAR